MEILFRFCIFISLLVVIACETNDKDPNYYNSKKQDQICASVTTAWG